MFVCLEPVWEGGSPAFMPWQGCVSGQRWEDWGVICMIAPSSEPFSIRQYLQGEPHKLLTRVHRSLAWALLSSPPCWPPHSSSDLPSSVLCLNLMFLHLELSSPSSPTLPNLFFVLITALPSKAFVDSLTKRNRP